MNFNFGSFGISITSIADQQQVRENREKIRKLDSFKLGVVITLVVAVCKVVFGMLMASISLPIFGCLLLIPTAILVSDLNKIIPRARGFVDNFEKLRDQLTFGTNGDKNLINRNVRHYLLSDTIMFKGLAK